MELKVSRVLVSIMKKYRSKMLERNDLEWVIPLWINKKILIVGMEITTIILDGVIIMVEEVVGQIIEVIVVVVVAVVVEVEALVVEVEAMVVEVDVEVEEEIVILDSVIDDQMDLDLAMMIILSKLLDNLGLGISR